MSIERHIWIKNFFIPRALTCFPIPSCVAESEARSTLYHIQGANRQRESSVVVFQYTLSGSGHFIKNGEVHEVSEGMGFLTQVGDPQIVYLYPEAATVPWRFLFFNFRDTMNYGQALTDALGHVFSVPADDPVIRRLRDLGNHTEKTLEMTAGEGHLLINGLLARLADGIRSSLSETTAVRLVRHAERLVRENLHRPYNAGMLADDLGLSQEHLCRVFRQELGTTPLSFLNEIKVRTACELLRTTSMSCRSIAEHLGYDPGSHFARLFKRVTGMAPLEFRKREIVAF